MNDPYRAWPVWEAFDKIERDDMAQAEAPSTADIEGELRRLQASERELAALAQQANEGHADLRDVYRLVVNARESAAKIGSALFAMGGVPTEPSW